MAFDSKWGGQWKAMTFHNKATGDETIALSVVEKPVAAIFDPYPSAVEMDVFGDQ